MATRNKLPMHPLLVHLPVGLWVASLAFDVIYLATARSTFAVSSFYCIGAGIIGALLAAPFGLIDYLKIPPYTVPKKLATQHLMLNLTALAFYILNFVLRMTLVVGAGSTVSPALCTFSHRFWLDECRRLPRGSNGF